MHELEYTHNGIVVHDTEEGTLTRYVSDPPIDYRRVLSECEYASDFVDALLHSHYAVEHITLPDAHARETYIRNHMYEHPTASIKGGIVWLLTPHTFDD